MGKKKITLVNKDANPSEYTTNDPTTITQLKSQGYVEQQADDDTSDPETGGAEGAGASTGTPTGSTKAKTGGGKAGAA